MPKISCNIIKDILPLYIDEIVSEETKTLVDEHIATCANCTHELSLLNSNLQGSSVIVTEHDDVAALKKIGFNIRKKQFFIGGISTLISAIVIILSFSYLTAPEYIPYTEDFDLITITDNNGNLSLSFTSEYKLTPREPGVYDISLYDTLWNQLFNANKSQTITINPNGDQVNTIYYVSNNGQEDEIIYGTNELFSGESITLPRLFLNYYFFFAILVTVSLSILLILFRNYQNLKLILSHIILLPISYLLSHLLITNLNGKSYSSIRDIYLILLLSLPIYFMFYLLRKHKLNKTIN